MGKIYSKYIKNEEHTWYDSSNTIYSVIFDDQTNNTKSLKIVFKGGRTYLYTCVEPIDYVSFRESESQGKVFNQKIKNYNCVKLPDTDLIKLDELKNYFQKIDKDLNKKYTIKYNNENGEFQLIDGNIPIFEGIEGTVSIINLFKSMGVEYNMSEYNSDEHNQTLIDFENNNSYFYSLI